MSEEKNPLEKGKVGIEFLAKLDDNKERRRGKGTLYEPETNPRITSESEPAKLRKIAAGLLAVSVAVPTAAGAYKLADMAFEGRSEADDVEHYIKGGTPEDMHPNMRIEVKGGDPDQGESVDVYTNKGGPEPGTPEYGQDFETKGGGQ
ncbi:MAG: hypothetical protein U5K77_00465 [Candidatus Saccharibacteria bacterium]|nr:hypothetical protein [Candidatus Saccharibacteria bacterium]